MPDLIAHLLTGHDGCRSRQEGTAMASREGEYVLARFEDGLRAYIKEAASVDPPNKVPA
jgi:hypothetical protein